MTANSDRFRRVDQVLKTLLGFVIDIMFLLTALWLFSTE